MYSEVLPHLRCPSCDAALILQSAETDATGEIMAGQLRCGAHTYPIRRGIVDFLGRPQPPNFTQLLNEWDATAWVYERAWRPFALTLLSGERFPYRRELPLLAELAQPERGGLFVDVACSNGLYARALTRAAARGGRSGTIHVLGVDHSQAMLIEAHSRARAAGLRMSFARATAQALPVASGAAHGVTIGGSLNEIGDLEQSLAEVRRTLAPTGRFVAMTLTRAASPAGRGVQALMAPAGVVFWTPDELTATFARHGLHTLRREQYGLVLFTLSVVRAT